MDSLFFWISKLVWPLLAPGSLLLVVLTGGLLLLWIGNVKWARVVLTTVSLLMLFIALFPVGEWLLYPLESKYSNRVEWPQQIDGIVVLSGAEKTKVSKSWGSAEFNGSMERDSAFIELAGQFPAAKLVFTGGTGSMIDQQTRAADIARRFFIQQGLDPRRILFERESRNTHENAIFSKKRVQPEADENWLLVTSAWHMPRAMGTFCQNRWKLIPYPVDYQTQRDNLLRIDLDFGEHLVSLGIGIKEWLGILVYSATGKMGSCR